MLLFLRYSWALIALAVVSSAGFGGETPRVDSVDIVIKAKVQTSSSPITLADVAELLGGSATLRERMAKLDLADLPISDSPVSINTRQIGFRLRLADLPETSFRLKGAPETLVFSVRSALDEQSVLRLARETLLKRLPWPEDDLDVKLARPIVIPRYTVAANEVVHMKAETHSTTVELGRAQINIQVLVGGEKRLTFPVHMEARLLQRIAYVRSAIAKGETLTENNVFIERRPVDPSNRNSLPAANVIGKRAKRPLYVGQVVGAADVDEEGALDHASVVIKPRQGVKMLVRLGAVNVVAQGEAMQEGRLGQTIRVQNVDSKKVVVGRVTGPATVEVDTGGVP